MRKDDWTPPKLTPWRGKWDLYQQLMFRLRYLFTGRCWHPVTIGYDCQICRRDIRECLRE